MHETLFIDDAVTSHQRSAAFKYVYRADGSRHFLLCNQKHRTTHQIATGRGSKPPSLRKRRRAAPRRMLEYLVVVRSRRVLATTSTLSRITTTKALAGREKDNCVLISKELADVDSPRPEAHQKLLRKIVLEDARTINISQKTTQNMNSSTVA